MKNVLRAIAFTRYGTLGASSRMRTMQYLATLERGGCDIEVRELLDDRYLLALYDGQRNLRAIGSGYAQRFLDCLSLGFRNADCILLEKELWPWAPAWLEKFLLRRKAWVLDLDDAIFHNYDRHRHPLVRKLYGRKIDKLMKAATIVTVGSPYLAQRAHDAGARDVRLIPTAVDLAKYPAETLHTPTSKVGSARAKPLIIGWIGSPATVHYLKVVTSALQEVAMHTDLTLRVIGATAPKIEGVRTESIAWTEETEVENICAFTIGIMPLIDSAWERGKCGYKLIQYMACGLPVVASPIGVNVDIVSHGESGLLADSTQAWTSALLSIANDRNKAREFGLSGRRRVEERYCTAITAKAVLASLRDASAGSTSKASAGNNQNFNKKR